MNTQEAILTLCDLFGQAPLKALLLSNSFFTDPGALKCHHDYVGGLADHSFGVFCRVRAFASDQYSPKTLFRIAMCHDLGKTGTYTKAIKNQKRVGPDGFAVVNEYGKFIWDEVEVFEHAPPAAPVLGHADASIIRALRAGVDLNDEELMAIRWHMGAYVNHTGEDHLRMNRAIQVCPLVALFQVADVLDANIPQTNDERQAAFRDIEGAGFLAAWKSEAKPRPSPPNAMETPF